jgi:hypothetical protein
VDDERDFESSEKEKKLWEKVRNGVITDEYRQVEKKVKNIIQRAKRNFEKRLAAGSNGSKRPFYTYVKQRTIRADQRLDR